MVTFATNDNDDSQHDESQQEIPLSVQMLDNDLQICSNNYNINDESDNDSSEATTTSSTSTTSSSTILQHIEGNNHHEIMTLSERRAHNIERNHKILLELGMVNDSNKRTTSKKSVGSHRRFNDSVLDATTTIEDKNNDDDETSHRPKKSSRGMIIPTCWSVMDQQQQHHHHQERRRQNDLQFDTTVQSSTLSSSSIEQLLHRYPSRSIQIRKLYSLLLAPILPDLLTSSTTSMASSKPSPTTSFVAPPPIIVTGPSGCGKTSIVRDVVRHCCLNHEFISLSKESQLVLHAYIDCLTLEHITVDEFISSAYSQWLKQIPQRNKDGRNHKFNKHKSKTVKNVSPDQKMEKGNNTTKRMSRTRRGKLNTSSIGIDRWQGQRVQHPQRNHNNDGSIEESPIHPVTTAQNTILTSMWMFGRSIQSLLNRIRHVPHGSMQSSNVPFILIVDHAEILLSMGATYSKTNAADRINLLVQLLLLPRNLGLNLSIILMTKNIHLQHAGMYIHFFVLFVWLNLVTTIG
jgi:Cdc6-like AAA superfamily ATPase